MNEIEELEAKLNELKLKAGVKTYDSSPFVGWFKVNGGCGAHREGGKTYTAKDGAFQSKKDLAAWDPNKFSRANGRRGEDAPQMALSTLEGQYGSFDQMNLEELKSIADDEVIDISEAKSAEEIRAILRSAR